MRYIVEYEDGSIYSSLDTNWNKLPRNKNIKTMGIYDMDENYHEISNYDIWFFSDEASTSAILQKPKWEARYIGGFKDGVGKVIKITLSGYEYTSLYYGDWKKLFHSSAFIFNRKKSGA